MARINKTAEVLARIAKQNVISLADLTSSRDLTNLFDGSRANPKRRIIDTTALLSKQGFVSVGAIDNEPIYKVTERGKAHLAHYQSLRQTKLENTIPWQGKWYFICYELPESKKAVRNSIILNFKRQGIINYTKGLWISPYDPTSLLAGLRTRYKLSPSQLWQFEGKDLPDEKRLLISFGLTKNTT